MLTILSIVFSLVSMAFSVAAICSMRRNLKRVAPSRQALEKRTGICPMCGNPAKLQFTGKGKVYESCDAHRIQALLLGARR